METTLQSPTLDDITFSARDLLKNQTPVHVGDIVNEYQKKWIAQIEDIISKHKNYADKYYILQWIEKEYGFINLMRNRCFVRKTRPDPDWNTDCYSYNNKTGEFILEWTLPPKEAALTIIRNRDQYDYRLVQSIQRFLSGDLYRDALPLLLEPKLSQKER